MGMEGGPSSSGVSPSPLGSGLAPLALLLLPWSWERGFQLLISILSLQKRDGQTIVL